jgi:hypothetical protein
LDYRELRKGLVHIIRRARSAFHQVAPGLVGIVIIYIKDGFSPICLLAR